MGGLGASWVFDNGGWRLNLFHDMTDPAARCLRKRRAHPLGQLSTLPTTRSWRSFSRGGKSVHHGPPRLGTAPRFCRDPKPFFDGPLAHTHLMRDALHCVFFKLARLRCDSLPLRRRFRRTLVVIHSAVSPHCPKHAGKTPCYGYHTHLATSTLGYVSTPFTQWIIARPASQNALRSLDQERA